MKSFTFLANIYKKQFEKTTIFKKIWYKGLLVICPETYNMSNILGILNFFIFC
jgi:hypothetical protein